ncbi:FUSC family protein [Methylobacterium tarhaniae]|uniref:FUSC family protein n=1 Tax=Methylobacterium tarhaniae TaxID=1187852 RepID=UPI003D08649D
MSITEGPATVPRIVARLAATGVPFGIRSALTALATLWLAMWLQLDEPRWAAWTVMALALPTRGQVGQKGAWRVLGTLAGLAAGLAGVAAFAQQSLAMGLFLSGWFALAAWAGGRLPGFAAHGAALAGLTAGLIAILSAASPLSAFSIALGRGAAIILGVACVYAASALAEIAAPARPAPAVPVALPKPASAAANGWRTLMVGATGWIVWTATAWPSGGIFVLFAGVVAIVFSTIPDSDRRARTYLAGACLGQAAGLAVRYGLLTAPASFGLLAALLFPFLFVGALGMTDARSTPPALGYNLAFLIAVEPTNPMAYDLSGSLNEGLALVSGIAFAAASFRFVYPRRVWRIAA